MLTPSPISQPVTRILEGFLLKSRPMSAGITRKEKTCSMPAKCTELTRTNAKLKKNKNSQRKLY